MATKTEVAPPKPDPEVARLEDAKAKFEAAVRKTAQQEGLVSPAATAVEPEKVPEKPEVAPKPKPAKRAAPKAESESVALSAKLEALSARLDAALAQKQEEPEEDPIGGFRAKLTERFGEDEAAALVETLEALHAPTAKRLAQLETVLAEATKSGRASISKSNQKRLSADYPQLATKKAWEIVNGQVIAAFEKNPKAYESAEEAYDDVVSSLYGSPEAEESETEEPEEDVELAASRIAASQMTAPASGRAERRTPEEKHKELHSFIMKHPDDKSGHRRLARELGIRP